MKVSKVPKDIIPFRAGVVVVTPLDANKNPMYERSVATEYNFLASTQIVITRTTETLENGNGEAKDFILDEKYTLTVTANVFNPIFHNTVTGRIETLPDKVLAPDEFTQSLPTTVETGGTLKIGFGTGKDHEIVPAADENGSYNFVVEDSYGNVLIRSETAELGTYVYDSDTKELQFSSDYKGESIRVIYWYEETSALVYKSNPVLTQPEYQIDIFGLSSSAQSGATIKVYQQLLRASVSGDVNEMTTQKSRSAPITYTFQSTPVPSGQSVYKQVLINVGESETAVDSIVNGLDDKLTSNA